MPRFHPIRTLIFETRVDCAAPKAYDNASRGGNKMQLFFGATADGRTFPDHPGAGGGALDSAVTGPAGFVNALEAQLGLLGPQVSKAVPMATYVAKLRAAGSGRFWSESFSKDPWSTAALLLGWRDALVMGGWSGCEIGSPRLDELAAVEQVGAMLAPGLADRLAVLVVQITKRPGLRLTKLSLLEPRTRFTPGWQRLFEALQATGVVVNECTAVPAAAPATDLGRVQAALRGEPSDPLQGDGSFTLVEADTALMAAE